MNNLKTRSLIESRVPLYLGMKSGKDYILRAIIPIAHKPDGDIALYRQYKRIYNIEKIQDIIKSTTYSHVEMGITFTENINFYDFLSELFEDGYDIVHLPTILTFI